MRIQLVSWNVIGFCALALMELVGVGLSNAQAPASAPVSADIKKSQVVSVCTSVSTGSSFCNPNYRLTAWIGGRQFELEGGIAKNGFIALGTYKVRLKTDEHKKPYLSHMVYELELPDGTTLDLTVVGESK